MNGGNPSSSSGSVAVIDVEPTLSITNPSSPGSEVASVTFTLSAEKKVNIIASANITPGEPAVQNDPSQFDRFVMAIFEGTIDFDNILPLRVSCKGQAGNPTLDYGLCGSIDLTAGSHTIILSVWDEQFVTTGCLVNAGSLAVIIP